MWLLLIAVFFLILYFVHSGRDHKTSNTVVQYVSLDVVVTPVGDDGVLREPITVPITLTQTADGRWHAEQNGVKIHA
ncbi:hypothetical protein ACJU26_11250 [Acidithiobacillus sp. M4-SHS-6]|uniref:hypothetical protein n=1 Tax=Acidithiobacillus sp. M4-SHS-6 TaxID=3383024 RepID=UPI0039BE633C